MMYAAILSMPVAGFSVGHDVTVTVVNPLTGAIITFGNITDFDSQEDTKAVESTPLSAPPAFGEIPHGWKLAFTIDRVDPTVDDFFAALEQAYWSGLNIPGSTGPEYIQEKNGTVTQYTYVGVAFKLDTAGSKRSQDKVTIKVAARASQRIKVV